MIKDNKFDKLTDFLSQIEKFSSIPLVVILRNSMINIVPIIITGSFFLLFFIFFREYKIFENYLDFLRKIYILTMGILSIYLSLSIGYNYASYYKKEDEKIIYSMVSLAGFLVSVLVYHNWQEFKVNEFLSLVGVKNMFSSIVISFLSCYLFSKLRLNFLKEKSIPSYVLVSLNSIFPFFIVIFIISLTGNLLKFNEILKMILLPIEKYGDNIIVVWVTNLFLHLTNFLGIHGISLINSLFLSLWQSYLVMNAESVINHSKPIYITAYPFFQWFIWIGGAGSTLGLNIVLLFSKSIQLKTIAKNSLIFSIFNINEPLLFGIPIVLNPFLFIPFILTPLVLGTINFIIFSKDLVNKVYVEVPWMFPSTIGAFLSTGDYKAILLNVISIIISALIYLPFIKAYEKYLLKQTNNTN